MMQPDTTAQCVECDVLFSKYEASTFELSRVYNALDIAAFLRDPEGIKRLTLKANEAADRQRSTREAIANHRDASHPDVAPVAA